MAPAFIFGLLSSSTNVAHRTYIRTCALLLFLSPQSLTRNFFYVSCYAVIQLMHIQLRIHIYKTMNNFPFSGCRAKMKLNRVFFSHLLSISLCLSFTIVVRWYEGIIYVYICKIRAYFFRHVHFPIPFIHTYYVRNKFACFFRFTPFLFSHFENVFICESTAIHFNDCFV